MFQVLIIDTIVINKSLCLKRNSNFYTAILLELADAALS